MQFNIQDGQVGNMIGFISGSITRTCTMLYWSRPLHQSGFMMWLGRRNLNVCLIDGR
jgi:hypothetical protein